MLYVIDVHFKYQIKKYENVIEIDNKIIYQDVELNYVSVMKF